MNPYYDPEWSVLPPENNRRYVCYRWTLPCACIRSPCYVRRLFKSINVLKTVNFESSVNWKLKIDIEISSQWNTIAISFFFHFFNKRKSIFLFDHRYNYFWEREMMDRLRCCYLITIQFNSICSVWLRCWVLSTVVVLSAVACALQII